MEIFKKFSSDLKREFKGYNSKRFVKDLLSGITVAAVALPLALAFGVSSGATAAAGLVTAIIAGVVISLLSGASFQISGPTGAMSAVLISIVSVYGLQGVFVASFFAGILIFLAGIFKIGKLISFIPSSVVMGFTSGIAVIIALGQIDNFFGTTSQGLSAIEKIMSYFELGFAPNLQALLIGVIVIAFMVAWPKKWNEKVPSSLIAIILATIITTIFGLDKLTIVGDIPKSLMLPESLKFSSISFGMIKGLSSPIITIATLGMIESLLCGASGSRMKEEPFDANRELIAQGVGNIMIPFFGGVPATAAIARTSVAIRSGCQTRLSGIIHAVVLFLSMVLLGSVMAKLPLSALAGVLMVTAWRMNEWHGIKKIFKYRVYSSITQFLITMIATVVFDLTIAIVVGVAFSAVLFIYKSSKVEVKFVEIDSSKIPELKDNKDKDTSSTLICHISGNLFFGAIDDLDKKLSQMHDCSKLIISMKEVPDIDMTCADHFLELCTEYEKKGVSVSFCRITPKVKKAFDKIGLTQLVGENNFFYSPKEAILNIK